MSFTMRKSCRAPCRCTIGCTCTTKILPGNTANSTAPTEAQRYQDEVARQEGMARTLGFNKVSVMKRNVALQIQDFVLGGGFLFTMCSGTDSFDIALAAEEVDICQAPFDGDPANPVRRRVDYDRGLAFQLPGHHRSHGVRVFRHRRHGRAHQDQAVERFLHAVRFGKWDIIPTMLTQSHERVILVSWGRPRRSASNSFGPM